MHIHLLLEILLALSTVYLDQQAFQRQAEQKIGGKRTSGLGLKHVLLQLLDRHILSTPMRAVDNSKRAGSFRDQQSGAWKERGRVPTGLWPLMTSSTSFQSTTSNECGGGGAFAAIVLALLRYPKRDTCFFF